MFNDMFDEIHIDKKWFYLTQARRKYYLGNEEGDLHRCTESTGFVEKWWC